MVTQDILQYVMIGVMLLCGYLFLLQAVVHRTENKNSVPAIAALLLVIYLLIAIPLLLIISSMGSLEMILAGTLLLFSCLTLFFAIYGLIRHFHELNKGMLILFLVYTLAVAYITIFSRERIRGSNSDAGETYLFRFDMIQQAFRTRSLEPVNHLLLNVAMFVPFGVLLPLIYPEGFSKWTYVLLMSLMFTTIIEFTQMMLHLGQADLTDMVANVLGALIGYAGYRVYARLLIHEE